MMGYTISCMVRDMDQGADRSEPDGAPHEEDWPPVAVQRFRASLGLSQRELAARVGTRQQTISEWETGTRAPRRMSRRLLHLVAEASGYYDPRGGAAGPHDDGPPADAPRADAPP